MRRQARRSRYVRYLDDFPRIAARQLWDDTAASELRRRQGLRRSDEHQGHRALHADVHRPGRPRARPDVRLGNNGLRRRAVGPALDHDRHLARGARAGAAADHGRRSIPWYLLADSPEGQQKEQSLTAQRAAATAVHGRHPAGLRLRARPAHHAEVDREQPRHQGGDDPRGDRRGDQAPRRLRAALRQAVRGPKKVRVAGPFTVESLSPHRSLVVRRTGTESLSETEAAKDADAPNFEQSILDNLAKAGIQNGRRQERITFAAFETYAGEYIQAIGRASRRGGRRRAVADRDRDRPAVRHRQPVVREEGRARGDRRRGRRPALRSSASPSTRRSPA